MDKFLSLLIFWLQLDCVSSKQEVNQSPEVLTVKEGDGLFLNCSCTDSAIYALQWYRQDPGKGLTFLLIQSSPGVQETGRIKAFFDKMSRHSALHIASAQLSDSATYLCAGEGSSGSAGKLVFGQGTALQVKPDIQNATPAVYQLENRKSDTRICLFTDFDSKTNVSDVLNDTVISSKNTVLDMKATNSKSNGVLFWSNTTKSGCEGISDEINYYSSAGIPCDAKLIEKGFETDINLNSQNLSVIALRILLLKVVGFNLLMTLRLWSS